MKILLTNDDGWDAPGLQTLHGACESFGEVWTVAPLLPMSGISHQMTFDRPLTLCEMDNRTFSLDGTPADCVRIALTQLEIEFDWVFSGINNGGNLGTDIYVSGTVAATREATICGARSIAFSQHRKKFRAEFDWTKTRWMADCVLEKLLVCDRKWESNTALNVNFPDRFHNEHPASLREFVTEEQFRQSLTLVDCEIDRNPIPVEFQLDDEGRFFYSGKYSQRTRSTGRDVEVCFGGDIAISILRF
jgi:5'-nucleotidase